MIALPGLLLATDRPDLAMLPNRFPEQGEIPEYNTVDATLWFFEAIRQYLAHRNDDQWRGQALSLIRDHLYSRLKSIVQAHLSGTRFGIHGPSRSRRFGTTPYGYWRT